MANFEKTVNYIEDCVDKGLISSASLSIGIKNINHVSKCFGYTSINPDHTLVNEETIYDMASVTKIMSTTMIALRFISEGKLDLADNLYRFFGDIVPEEKRDISIFHLMTHTSGYPAHICLYKELRSPSEVIPYLLKYPLSYATSSKVEYSCIGFILLGLILEKISGKSLDVLAKEEVFSPLSMDSTSYHLLDQKIVTNNTAYTEKSIFDNEWLVGRVHDENAFYFNGVAGNAGVFSNLKDCTSFASMLACHGSLNGNIYLPRTIFDGAIKNYTPNLDSNRGLGFYLANEYDCMSGVFFAKDCFGFGHNGFTGPSIFVNPNTGLYVVLLTNRVHPTRDNANHLRIRRVMHTLASIEAEGLV